MSKTGPRPRLRPKVYAVAIYLVLLFVIAEMLMLGGSLWFRRDKVRLEIEAPPLPSTAAQLAPAVTTAAPDAPVPNLPPPASVGRMPLVPKNEKIIGEVAQLNADARQYRQNGDLTGAETALAQALELDPANPQTLAAMAALQEDLGNRERALAYWEKIIAAGIAGEKAVAVARDRVEAVNRQILADRQAREREISRATLKRQIVIGPVKAPPLTVAAGEVQIDFPIKRADPALLIDPKKMLIRLYFYDQLPDDRFQVAGKIAAEWIGSSNWTKTDTEILRARYTPGTDTQGNRNRYAWLIRVYYDGVLQDEQANPPDLLRLFPAGAAQ